MKFEDLSSVSQLIEAMDLAVKELEKGIKNRDAKKTNKSKEEILKFYSDISRLLNLDGAQKSNSKKISDIKKLTG